MTPNDTTYGRTARRTVIAGASLVAMTGTAAAHGGGSTGGGMMGGGGGGLLAGPMAALGLVWMGLLLAIPLLVLYSVVGRGGARNGVSRARGRSTGRGGERSRSTLRERYARGELSDEEFERRRDRLAPDG